MIEYREFGAEELSRVQALYEDAGWTAYLGGPDKLARAFAMSLYVLGAFQNGVLVGFVRCVGDGEHIVYVQDLIVEAVPASGNRERFIVEGQGSIPACPHVCTDDRRL